MLAKCNPSRRQNSAKIQPNLGQENDCICIPFAAQKGARRTARKRRRGGRRPARKPPPPLSSLLRTGRSGKPTSPLCLPGNPEGNEPLENFSPPPWAGPTLACRKGFWRNIIILKKYISENIEMSNINSLKSLFSFFLFLFSFFLFFLFFRRVALKEQFGKDQTRSDAWP